MNEQRQGLIRDIEVLRAVAVLGVIFKHMNGSLFPKAYFGVGFAPLFDGGWVGVDLFFAISGFVIARSLLPKARNAESFAAYRSVSYQFWIMRFFRLVPSAWFWLAVILLLCVGYNQSGVFGSLETNLYWTLAGVFNFANYLFVQYFGVKPPGVSFAYWSLSLEEQFYLLFPVIVWIFNRRLAWLLVALVVLQVTATRGLYGMMFRTDAISLGVLLALLQGHGYLLPPVGALWSALGRVVVILAVVLLFYLAAFEQSELPYQLSILALCSVTLVWLCSGAQNVLAGSGIIGRGFVWIGQRSYAMYLIHIPAMYFLRESAYRLGIDIVDYRWGSAMLSLVLIVALAEGNYRWVENPLRRRGKALAARLSARRRQLSQLV
ncbi:MAG: acyltransferase [Gammaproteobacteria bacterium]|nr:acyltransferase [Gammaproteobacteria bacterium]